MAAPVKSTSLQKARRCDCEQMLRQQHAQPPFTAMSRVLPTQAPRSEWHLLSDQPFVDRAAKVSGEPNV